MKIKENDLLRVTDMWDEGVHTVVIVCNIRNNEKTTLQFERAGCVDE